MGKKSYVKFIEGEKRVEEMSSAELAYLAGVIDGCGTLELNRKLEPQLRIEKKSDLAKSIALKVGGYLRYRKPDRGTRYYRYALAVRGKMLKSLLIRIRPLLQTNKRRIGVPLLIEAFETEDLKILNQIKQQLSKREMGMKLEELAKRDDSWFHSYI